MTLDELEAELEVLKETRETSERELAALAGRRGKLQAMERDRGLILESFATFAPLGFRSVFSRGTPQGIRYT